MLSFLSPESMNFPINTVANNTNASPMPGILENIIDRAKPAQKVALASGLIPILYSKEVWRYYS